MKNNLFIFRKRNLFKDFELYPFEYHDTVCNIVKQAIYPEQIYIHREGNNLFYVYISKLSSQQDFGICLVSDRLCTDYEGLTGLFQTLLSELASSKLGIKSKGNNSFCFTRENLKEQRVDFDIFIDDTQEKIDAAFRKSVEIPPASIDKPKSDVVKCSLEVRNSSWIASLITRGYYNVYILPREQTAYRISLIELLRFKQARKIASLLLSVVLCLGMMYYFYVNHVNDVSKEPKVSNLPQKIGKGKKQIADSVTRKDDKEQKNEELSIFPITDSVKIHRKAKCPKDFVLVPKGVLKNKEYDTKRGCYVTYTYNIDSFYICKYELTQGEYKRIMGELNINNYKYEYFDNNVGDTFVTKKSENLPVIGSYFEFAKYCNKRSFSEGYDGFYEIKGNNIVLKKNGNGYRLPFSLEWTFAAKGGNANQECRYVGSKNINEVAWWGKNSNNKPHVVGQKKANALGLYDMAGNVGELLQSRTKSGHYHYIAGSAFCEWIPSGVYLAFGPYDTHGYYLDHQIRVGTRIAFVPKGMKSNQDMRQRCDD